MMRKLGSKRAYEVGGHAATAALLLISQSFRGASGLQRTVQLLMGVALMLPAHVAGVAGRQVLMSQGLAKVTHRPRAVLLIAVGDRRSSEKRFPTL